jgi:serine/threonine protein kinase
METTRPDSVFATLTPANAAAKFAFHRIAEASMAQPVPVSTVEGTISRPESYHTGFIDIDLHKQYERDVEDLQEGRHQQPDSDATSTALDTDTEGYLHQQYTIWNGKFVFNLSARDPERSPFWILRKGRKDNPHAYQFVLHDRNQGLRGCHAIFRLCSKTGYLTLSAFSLKARNVLVDGLPIELSARTLNKKTARIRLENVDFSFQYTPYANTLNFLVERNDFVKRMHPSTTADTLHITPTPNSANTVVGHWTISTVLGRGTYGKVYSATNQMSEVVAVKAVERTPKTAHRVQEMRAVLEKLTCKVKEARCERIIHLRESIPANAHQTPLDKLKFELVYFVLSPAVSITLDDFMPKVDRKSGSMQPATLLRDVLEGLRFLHLHSWLHGDIKPGNIGISNDRAVILDVDSLFVLAPKNTLEPTPGSGGTISYLAPERELMPYDHLVDVWATGVVGYELLYGYYPWQRGSNPWRPGEEQHISCFKEKHHSRCKQLSRNDHSVADLVLNILRYSFSGINGKSRVTAKEALAHPSWKSLGHSETDGGPESKKRKQ